MTHVGRSRQMTFCIESKGSFARNRHKMHLVDIKTLDPSTYAPLLSVDACNKRRRQTRATSSTVFQDVPMHLVKGAKKKKVD